MKKLVIFSIFLLSLYGSILDEIYIKMGYENFYKKDFKKAKRYFEKVNSLESRYASGVVSFYLNRPKEAIEIFKSIKTKDKDIKSKIFFNIALCYEKVRDYERALKNYIKSYKLKNSKKTFKKIEKLIFLKNEKKLLLPFSKEKIVKKRGKKSNSKSKSKSAGASNINLALKSSSSKGGKKKKGASVSKKAETIPVSSKVYELINRGYVDEKNPW